MNAADIENALAALGEKMRDEGLRGEMLLTGGAVMTLVLDERGTTKDVDAAFAPHDDIKRISVAIAEGLGLPSGWLSDSVTQFIGDSPRTHAFRSYGGEALVVTRVAEDYLLAMKMMASRHGTEDLPDIARLCRRLGIADPDEAMDVLYSYFPARNAPMGVREAVVEALGMGLSK